MFQYYSGLEDEDQPMSLATMILTIFCLIHKMFQGWKARKEKETVQTTKILSTSLIKASYTLFQHGEKS